MITIVDLQTSLLDLLHEIEGSEVKVIIGGGFGIYLKVVHVAKEGRRTLWREWPEPRSTNDLDLFLRPELLIESEKLKPLAEAIERLGYQAVAGAEKYQFVICQVSRREPWSRTWEKHRIECHQQVRQACGWSLDLWRVGT